LLSLYAFANIGTIMALKGKATVERGTSINAKMGMSINQGDRVTTRLDSRVQIMLKDESVITIGANSAFDFREYQFDGTKKSKANFKIGKGYVRAITGKIAKLSPERFHVKTTTALIGIRGTDFSVQIAQNKEIIRCYSGAIWVKLDKGDRHNVNQGMLLEIQNKGVTVKKLTDIPTQRSNLPNDLTDMPTPDMHHQERYDNYNY
ncbi:MAG: FecR domain-containing protein, partial [Campylobacterales bacterium]|nr:FecR domain-containing protein [Campylobacterales bacterium]